MNKQEYFDVTCKNGQAMIEYIIVAGILMSMMAVMALFLYIFRENSGRILDFVASEYP